MPSSEFPAIGFGTWKNTDPEQCAASVASALEVGYRHVDTAQYYGNEAYVGEGIDRASVDRDDVAIATKVHPETAGLGFEDVIQGATESCDRLGVDVLDLYYVHWPILDYEPEETLAGLSELVDRGVIRHVGVSNFSIELLDEARRVLDVPLFAHQVEMHPLLHQDELVAYAQEHDHYLVAYSPLAQGEVFEIQAIGEIAEKHDASAAEVSLAWLHSKENVVPIPKSTDPAHARENLSALDLALDDEDLSRIDGIEDEKRFVERDGAPWLDS